MNDIITLTEKKEIIYSSFILNRKGIEPIGDPTFDQWLECGKFIRRAGGAVHFWIGDWLNYGETKWGEKYREAIEMTGFDYQTVANDKWVTFRISPERRRGELTFDHHQTVADFDEDEQDKLLQDAVDKKLPTKIFRKYVDERINLFKPNKPQFSGRPENYSISSDQLLAELDLLKKHLENFNFKDILSEQRNLLFNKLSDLVGEINTILSEK